MAAFLTTAPVLAAAGRCFDWTASGLGALVGFGAALALVGSIALVRGRPAGPRQRGGTR